MAMRPMAELAPAIDRVRELAEPAIPSPRTLRVHCWDDGDFAVRIYHTHPIEAGVGGRTSVRYRSGEPAVRYTHQRVDRESGQVLERDERVLARFEAGPTDEDE